MKNKIPLSPNNTDMHPISQQNTTASYKSMHINAKEQRKPAIISTTNAAFVYDGAVIVSSIPRRGGASRGGRRAMRGHQLNPVPPPHHHHHHQPHPYVINTDVNTLNEAKSEDETVLSHLATPLTHIITQQRWRRDGTQTRLLR